jgi:predicted dehydrogenase
MADIGVGMVGYKFMGRAHSNAYRQVPHFFDVDPVPRMQVLCGRDEAAAREAADKLGWADVETDYRKMVTRDDIGLVDVSSTGNTHFQVVMAALAAGKHVFCEKPLANSLDEARQMMEAARDAGVVAMIDFNYRKVPAVAFAQQLIAEGRLGEIRHWRAVYLQDWITDPGFPLVWRLQKELAGSGALGDIAAHIVDLSHFLSGPMAEGPGTMKTFFPERRWEVASAGGSGLSAAGSAERGPVTVDDAASFLARFENGATGTFEVTRLAPGRRNYNSFEVNGSNGSLYFNLERLNELEVYFSDDPAGLQGFRTINVTEPNHPFGIWWPAGHIIGYEHTFTHQVKTLLDGIHAGVSPAPTFEDGYRCQAVLDAVERSNASGNWEKPASV